eukprot:CAMPEP_0116091464 /NCGR_PEP_ID=MMETSP0327-20121206/7520_1 /TAXON_ID=44447 /ORGANISM="Pseudo-nitzschia delicatissima, Strain B596" /LENGTH=866 /DNA_ID=CAMNT_0003582819 /DNA_START=130 /DNA_END=2730 /DNA_ORIENTATION=+
MTSIENNNTVVSPPSNPDGEGGEETKTSTSDLISRVSVVSLPDPSAWMVRGVSQAAEESWISQSLAMPSTANGDSTSTETTTTNLPTSNPRHRREGSLESFLAVSEPTQSEWAAHASTLSEQHNDTPPVTGIPVPTPTSRNSSAASNPYMNINSWGDSSFGNHAEAVFDPTTFTTSFSGSTDDDPSGIPSDIHDAARIFNWRVVGELCETKPEAAAYIGDDGWTALHHCCNRRCPDADVVEKLIHAYPDALLITEDKGWTPLHYACRFKAPMDVVALLLNLYPERGQVGVSRADRRGRMPLYYAVRYSAPPGVVGLLMDVDASAVLEEDQNSDSPLALIWDDYAEKLDGRKDILKILVGEEEAKRADVIMYSLGKIFVELDHSSKLHDRIERAQAAEARLKLREHVLKLWDKANTFLKAAFGFQNNDESTWRILHAVSAIKCHSTLFLMAVCLHPEQAMEVDQNDLLRLNNIYKAEESIEGTRPSDLTALHLAASSSATGDAGKLVLTQLLAVNPNAATCIDTEASTPLHRIAGNKCKSDWTADAVEDVYRCYEGAIRRTDANGRLPLHRAASAITSYDSKLDAEAVTSKSKICNLLREHVGAASQPDNFGCLPLHLVAENGVAWDAQVKALYEGNPAAVRVRTGVKLSNRLPLHFAASNPNSDASMIGKLLEYNPLAASQADRKGKLPLHLACESGHSWEVVRLIHEAYPQAVTHAEQNKRGWHALHMAAASEVSDGTLLSELLNLYPNAATVSDKQDRFPMHLACTSGKVWGDGLSPLFEANASAIRCRNQEGMLPLHIVAFRYRYRPPTHEETLPQITNRSNRRSKSLIALELERKTQKEHKEALELTNIFEILISDPTALLA